MFIREYLFDIQMSSQLKMSRLQESRRLNLIPSDGIEGGRKVTAESTKLAVKVSPANRLPVLRSVIICRSDTELAEEILGREMTGPVSRRHQKHLESPFKS